jgi:hypothetical protein
MQQQRRAVGFIEAGELVVAEAEGATDLKRGLDPGCLAAG